MSDRQPVGVHSAGFSPADELLRRRIRDLDTRVKRLEEGRRLHVAKIADLERRLDERDSAIVARVIDGIVSRARCGEPPASAA